MEQPGGQADAVAGDVEHVVAALQRRAHLPLRPGRAAQQPPPLAPPRGLVFSLQFKTLLFSEKAAGTVLNRAPRVPADKV